jgi:flagellar biosynthetic protein FliQ
MSADYAIDLIRRGVLLALSVAGPMLLTALIVGLIVSLIQAVTQVQEQTLTFIPKIVVMAIVFALSLPWIVTRMVGFVIGTLNNLSVLAT